MTVWTQHGKSFQSVVIKDYTSRINLNHTGDITTGSFTHRPPKICGRVLTQRELSSVSEPEFGDNNNNSADIQRKHVMVQSLCRDLLLQQNRRILITSIFKHNAPVSGITSHQQTGVTTGRYGDPAPHACLSQVQTQRAWHTINLWAAETSSLQNSHHWCLWRSSHRHCDGAEAARHAGFTGAHCGRRHQAAPCAEPHRCIRSAHCVIPALIHSVKQQYTSR